MHDSKLCNESSLEHDYRRYGFLPFLFLLNQYEQSEEYEKCAIICDLLKSKEAPSKYNREAIDKYLHYFKRFNMSGDIAVQNMRAYASDIQLTIDKLCD